MRSEGDTGSRRARWFGVTGFAGRRIAARVAAGGPNRVVLAVAVVAVAIAILVVVTGVGLELASQSTVHGSGVDYWITPASGSTLTTVVSTRGPQLGDVHGKSETIGRAEGVSYATPVLVEVVRIRAEDAEKAEYVLAVGVVPSERGSAGAGTGVDSFTGGDPHFAGGTYDGPVTGEILLSPAAAELLDASAGSDLVVASPASGRVKYSYSVTGVETPGFRPLGGEAPVAVFHLSELQALTGAAKGDQADQILVRTDSPGVKSELEAVYPDATVVSRSGLTAGRVVDSDLPLAVVVTTLVVGLVVPLLFVTTSMGLEVESDRRVLAVLTAVGFGPRERLLFVAATTLAVTVAGGLVGVLLGSVAIVAFNAVWTGLLSAPPVARFHAFLIPYGLAVALLVGALAAPYPLLLARRTTAVEELMR